MSRKLLLKGLNLSFDGGCCYCVAGASGVGKTSLLMSMARRGALRDEANRWQPATYITPRETISAEQASVKLFLGLLRAPAQLHRWRLAHVADQGVSGLSLGEKARLSLAVASALDPAVLLLDEPSIGLDPQGQSQLTQLIAERSIAGRITIVSTHDLTAVDMENYKILYLSRVEDELAVVNDAGRILMGRADVDLDGLGRSTLSGSAIGMARSLLHLQLEHLQ